MSSTNAQIHHSFRNIFGKRNKNPPRLFRREGAHRFFLRFRSQRIPPMPAAARSSQIQGAGPEDVTKIAVGPSAPPMMPRLRAFVMLSTDTTSVFSYFTPWDNVCQSFPHPPTLTFPPAGGIIVPWIRQNAPPRAPPRVKTEEHADMMELGSDASAAGGGESELSAWQRSTDEEGACRRRRCRAPQQEDLLDSPILTDQANRIRGYDGIGRRVGFRFLCLGVWVRVPLSAPTKSTSRKFTDREVLFYFCNRFCNTPLV